MNKKPNCVINVFLEKNSISIVENKSFHRFIEINKIMYRYVRYILIYYAAVYFKNLTFV